jgi:AraC-like DNA-binding protein
MQIPPSPALAAVVKHYLIIENNNQSANLKHRMFSDGNTGMVFNYGDALLHQRDQLLETLPKCFMYGQLDAFQHIISVGKIGMLIVVFHPFGASGLLKVPAAELKNAIFDADSFFPRETGILLDNILHQTDALSRIQIVEHFLLRKLVNQPHKGELAIHAVHLINQHHGNLSVAALTPVLQVSERQLQRIFEEHIGLTPKRFSGVIRIQYFLKLLRKSPATTSLTQMVYDCGFYDQAHMIREMKNISGFTPGQYAGQPALLAANLLQITT